MKDGFPSSKIGRTGLLKNSILEHVNFARGFAVVSKLKFLNSGMSVFIKCRFRNCARINYCLEPKLGPARPYMNYWMWIYNIRNDRWYDFALNQNYIWIRTYIQYFNHANVNIQIEMTYINILSHLDCNATWFSNYELYMARSKHRIFLSNFRCHSRG